MVKKLRFPPKNCPSKQNLRKEVKLKRGPSDLTSLGSLAPARSAKQRRDEGGMARVLCFESPREKLDPRLARARKNPRRGVEPRANRANPPAGREELFFFLGASGVKSAFTFRQDKNSSGTHFQPI